MKLLIFGAGSAIALEVARKAANDRADILLVGRNASRLKTVSDDLQVRGATRVQIITADLARTEAHEELIESAIASLGGIDAVLLAHGTLGDQSKSEHDVNVMLAEINTNAVSYLSLLTILANYFEAQRSGSIVVMSSVAGDRGRRSNYVYGTAKSALTTFTSGLRARLHRSGVHVVTVKPGMVDTPMTAGMKKGVLFAKPEKVGERIYQALIRGEDIVYVPWFWRPIMFVIRSLPERLFKRLTF